VDILIESTKGRLPVRAYREHMIEYASMTALEV